MIEGERITYDKYESQGYDIIKAGAPDLILLKDGVISFVEVKSKIDKLSQIQERAFKLLRKHGFDAKVEIVMPNPTSREESDYDLFMKSMTRREINEYFNLPYPERMKVMDKWLRCKNGMI